MKTLPYWKKSIYSAIIFFGTLVVLSIGYSALFGWLSTADKVGTGSGLTSASWNRIVDGVLDLDTRLSNLSFSGGNVGIGTASPGAKLDITGQVKITGGAPGAGKVLTSDAAGLANWDTPPSDTTEDGWILLEGGTANALYTPYRTFQKGIYMAWFYNCLTSASTNHYVSMSAESSNGGISAGYTNREFSQLASYNQPAFIVKVRSTTANVRFKVWNPSSGSDTITNAAGCSNFIFTQIGK